MADIQKVSGALSIMDVILRESKILVRKNFDFQELGKSERKTVSQTFRNPGEIIESELMAQGADENRLNFWRYDFDYSFGIRMLFEEELDSSNSDEFVSIVEIAATFQARYLAKSLLDNQEELALFSKDNVAFNIWPFWREYVHSTCSRIGMTPPFEVPFFRLPKKEGRQKAPE